MVNECAPPAVRIQSHQGVPSFDAQEKGLHSAAVFRNYGKHCAPFPGPAYKISYHSRRGVELVPRAVWTVRRHAGNISYSCNLWGRLLMSMRPLCHGGFWSRRSAYQANISRCESFRQTVSTLRSKNKKRFNTGATPTCRARRLLLRLRCYLAHE